MLAEHAPLFRPTPPAGFGVDWVLLADIVPEPREDLRFSSAHRLLWEHFWQDFDYLPVDSRHPWIHLLRRRIPAQP